MRRSLHAVPLLLLASTLLLSLGGCLSTWTSTSSPAAEEEPAELGLQDAELPERVGQIARPFGLSFATVESLGVVNGLPGTGGIPQPSRQRSDVERDLRTYDLPSASQFLDSDATALVSVTAFLPPGAKKDDLIDLKVQLSSQSNASDLTGGWLMPARLREMQLLGGMIRDGDVLATGSGEVIAEHAVEGTESETGGTRGVIPGGGRVAKDRQLGLNIRQDNSQPLSVRVGMAKRIATAINRRFWHFDGIRQSGIASPKNDGVVTIAVHPRYARNVHRQMNVIQAISLRSDPDRPEFLQELGRQLGDVATASQAALQLEAIGEPAAPILKQQVSSPNAELRFYAAEALAYLDNEAAIAPLVELLMTEPAFRHSALRAVGTMDHPSASIALSQLLHEASNEIRYGAYRELADRTDAASYLARQNVNGKTIAVIPSAGPPLVVAGTVRQSEFVIFGAPLALDPETLFYAAGGLTVRGESDGRIRISRFAPGTPDQRVLVQATVEGCIEGILKLDAPTSSVISFLREIKNLEMLPGRFAVNPIPETGRTYHRPETGEGESGDKVAAKGAKSSGKEKSGWLGWW